MPLSLQPLFIHVVLECNPVYQEVWLDEGALFIIVLYCILCVRYDRLSPICQCKAVVVELSRNDIMHMCSTYSSIKY